MAYFRPGHATDHAEHTLQELCLFKIVDNLDLLGDVGDTPAIFLERIFAHCTLEQLKRIEDASHGRDLESTTNEFWHRFYQKKWGAEAAQAIGDRVSEKGLPLRWRALYEHKVKQEEQVQAKCVSRLRELFIKERNDKQSRTVQVCARRPEVKKKPWGPQTAVAPTQRGRLLAKAKKEYAGSFDALRRKTQLQTAKSSPGKRPAPVSPTSAGPVQKRPALGSPQNQVRMQPTGQSTRPQAQDARGALERNVLGKRPASHMSASTKPTGAALKRRVLGSPESEASLRISGVLGGAKNNQGLGKKRVGDPAVGRAERIVRPRWGEDPGSSGQSDRRQKVEAEGGASRSGDCGRLLDQEGGLETSSRGKEGRESRSVPVSKPRLMDGNRYEEPTRKGAPSTSRGAENETGSLQEGIGIHADKRSSTQGRPGADADASKKRLHETMSDGSKSDSLGRKKGRADLASLQTDVYNRERKMVGILADDENLWGDDP